MTKTFNCTPKFDQPVKIPTRSQILSIFENISGDIIDRVYHPDDFVKKIADFIAKHFIVNVLQKTSFSVELNEVIPVASYSPKDDENCRVSIEVTILTSPQKGMIILDQTSFKEFVLCFADSIIHQLVHMKQFRSRDYLVGVHYCNDDNSEVQYLSNPDEIDAYSYNIADELSVYPDSLKKLLNAKRIKESESMNLWAYVNAFNQDIQSPIIKKLIKKVYKKLSVDIR